MRRTLVSGPQTRVRTNRCPGFLGGLVKTRRNRSKGVSHPTFLYLSVPKGKPSVSFLEVRLIPFRPRPTTPTALRGPVRNHPGSRFQDWPRWCPVPVVTPGLRFGYRHYASPDTTPLGSPHLLLKSEYFSLHSTSRVCATPRQGCLFLFTRFSKFCKRKLIKLNTY